MNVSGLNVRVTIQKSVAKKDKYRNRLSVWEDYFTCWAAAMANGRDADETENAGHTEEADRLDITVRWCTETAAVDSKQYRIILNGRIYNITGIDEMGFRRNSRKFHARLAER